MTAISDSGFAGYDGKNAPPVMQSGNFSVAAQPLYRIFQGFFQGAGPVAKCSGSFFMRKTGVGR